MTDAHVTDALSAVLNQPKNVRSFKRKLDALELDENEFQRVVYQTVGDILKLGDNVCKETLKPILKNLKKKKVGWHNPMYDDMRQKMEEHDDYLVNPFEVAEGIATAQLRIEEFFKEEYLFKVKTEEQHRLSL